MTRCVEARYAKNVTGMLRGSPGELRLRIIKRYANRKLYDTCDSKYVTLQEIAVFVRSGDEVRIIDNRSKEDLTNITLAQVVYEEEKKADASECAGSVVPTLRSLIQQGRTELLAGGEWGPQESDAGDLAYIRSLEREVGQLRARIEDLEVQLSIATGRFRRLK